LPGSLYDHLLAIVLVGALFGAAVVALPNVGYVGLLSVDQQQLRNVALSALNTMLLDAGYPTNWGAGINFNPSSVVRFGLASTRSSSLYFLDADKVQKLFADNPSQVGYLPYETVRQLLRLQGYGFSLKIMPPFNATAKDLAPPANPSNPTDLELKNINYEVTVKLNDGKPISNAVVNALIFYSIKVGGQGQNEQYNLNNVRVTQTTNELGKCTIVKTLDGQISDVLIVLEVTVGDIHTVSSVYRRGAPPDDIANINIVGDTIILTTPPADPRDNRWILTISAYTEGGIISLYNGTQQDMINWGSLDEWLKTLPGLKYMDPVILIFNFRAVEKGNGRKGILVIGYFPGYLGSRVLSYGSSAGRPFNAVGVGLQRVVIIAGMTYVVDFTLWKQYG